MNSRSAQFRRDGFLVLEGFNTPEACDALMQRGQELAADFDFNGHGSVFQTSEQSKTTDDYFLDSGDKISFFFEKDAFDNSGKLKGDLFHSLNKIGHALHDLDPVFDAFSRSPQMKALAADLELNNWLIIQSMLIFKHARIGGVVDIHQDSTFLFTEPDSCIGFWFALEDAYKENGCLWAKPGGHQCKLHARFQRKIGGGTEMIHLNNEAYDTEGMIPLEVKKGTCIVLHGLLPHYSLPNSSGKSRQAYAIHTIDKKTVYPETNWLQRDMKKLRGF
ncbi:MAG: phytanoyl-CoA dioxygenase family protein [Ferruginibacter sp.]